MTRRMLALIVGAVALAAVAVTVFVVTRPDPTGLPRARAIVADTARFESGPVAAQAMYDASRELLRAAQACRSARRDEARCRPLFEASAVGQATTAALPRCQLPTLYTTRQTWASYLDALRRVEDGAEAPTIPTPPRCEYGGP